MAYALDRRLKKLETESPADDYAARAKQAARTWMATISDDDLAILEAAARRGCLETPAEIALFERYLGWKKENG